MHYEHNISQLIAPDTWRGGRLHLDAKPGESEEELMDRAAKIHEDWFKKKYLPESDFDKLLPPFNASSELPVINYKEHERLEMLIDDCQTTEELKKYKDNLSTPRLMGLWMEKNNKLSNK